MSPLILNLGVPTLVSTKRFTPNEELFWKKIAISTVVVAIVLAGVLYFNSAKSVGPPTSTINPACCEYISSYTAGVVTSGSPIRIVLSKDVIDSTALGEIGRAHV